MQVNLDIKEKLLGLLVSASRWRHSLKMVA